MRILSTLLKIGQKREFTQFSTKGKTKLNSWEDNIKWLVFISGGSNKSIFCNCLSLNFLSHKNYTEPYYKKKRVRKAKHPQGSGTFHLSKFSHKKNHLAEYKNQQEIYLVSPLQSISFEILTSQKIV